MLRIISGEQRGRKIEVPAGARVRPPSDRARQAIFNQVRGLVAGRPVLDLFAGSGAYGLEALSRGASHATFVELNRRVLSVLRENIAHLGYAARTTVLLQDVFRWVRRVEEWPPDPAMVFVAPPYAFYRHRMDEVQLLWGTLIDRGATDTVLVLQLNGSFDTDLLPPAQRWDVRPYGDVKSAICQIERPASTEPTAIEVK